MPQLKTTLATARDGRYVPATASPGRRSPRVGEAPVLIACWSPKGGAGTTVVSAALALILARDSGAALAADLTGDLPTVLGLAEPAGPGLAEWLAAGANVPPHGLRRIEVPAAPRPPLLPGSGPRGDDGGHAGGEAPAPPPPR